MCTWDVVESCISTLLTPPKAQAKACNSFDRTKIHWISTLVYKQIMDKGITWTLDVYTLFVIYSIILNNRGSLVWIIHIVFTIDTHCTNHKLPINETQTVYIHTYLLSKWNLAWFMKALCIPGTERCSYAGGGRQGTSTSVFNKLQASCTFWNTV